VVLQIAASAKPRVGVYSLTRRSHQVLRLRCVYGVATYFYGKRRSTSS
jgi:hypothetical protein